MSFLVFYVTHPDEKTARSISKQLLEENLIACANCYAMVSLYRWKGEIIDEVEWVSLLKTKQDNEEALAERIEELHPYEVPCILRYPVTANASYESWITESSSRAPANDS